MVLGGSLRAHQVGEPASAVGRLAPMRRSSSARWAVGGGSQAPLGVVEGPGDVAERQAQAAAGRSGRAASALPWRRWAGGAALGRHQQPDLFSSSAASGLSGAALASSPTPARSRCRFVAIRLTVRPHVAPGARAQEEGPRPGPCAMGAQGGGPDRRPSAPDCHAAIAAPLVVGTRKRPPTRGGAAGLRGHAGPDGPSSMSVPGCRLSCCGLRPCPTASASRAELPA
jgi:hypothetical protein